MTRLTILALTLTLATSAHAAEDLWTHNGSLMSVGPDRTVVYLEPRPGLPVLPGAVLFQGNPDNISGVAFGFVYGCPSTPYKVHIVKPQPNIIILEGAAPVLDAITCRVLELTWQIPASRLLFTRVK